MPKIHLCFQCTQLKTAGKREKAFSVVQDQPTVATLYEAVWKVSSHLEYLENQSRGLDVTW